MEEYVQSLIGGFVMLTIGLIVICLHFIAPEGLDFIYYSLGLVGLGVGVGILSVVTSMYKLEKKLKFNP
ncbi:MAG: hypothetical protein NWF01_06725 [Candidatus Bathyarchaeota archaeon]|nr:hypothetical protein [Candidatus Bathyarchaeota archaeon]